MIVETDIMLIRRMLYSLSLVLLLLCVVANTTVAAAAVAQSNKTSGAIKGRLRFDGNGRGSVSGVSVIVRQGEHEVTKTETNGKGEFEINGLEPGVYGLTFRKPGLSVGTLEKVEVRAGKVTTLSDRLYMTIDDGSLAIIRGSVFDKQGRAIRGAEVEIALVQPDGKLKKIGEDLSSESGMFHFRLSPNKANYRVTVKADGMQAAAQDVEVDGASRNSIAITLQPIEK